MNPSFIKASFVSFALTSIASAQLPSGFFTDVKRVPGVNSSSAEWSIGIAPDNGTLYFGSNRPNGEGDLDLYQATRVDGGWGNVMSLGTGVNSPSYEGNPTVTADGMTLYFTSDRDGGQGSFDIYMATRDDPNQQFGNVQNLGPGINSPGDDGGQTLTAGGRTIFFNSLDRDGGFGGYDLYSAQRIPGSDSFEPLVNLGPAINTDANEFVPFITLDGKSLLFSDSYFQGPFRPSGEGLADIWISGRSDAGDAFGDVLNIGAPVNTSAIEVHPVLSSDWPIAGSTLYFLSNRPGSAGGTDIWQATWVPEPSTTVMATAGFLGLLLLRHRI